MVKSKIDDCKEYGEIRNMEYGMRMYIVELHTISLKKSKFIILSNFLINYENTIRNAIWDFVFSDYVLGIVLNLLVNTCDIIESTGIFCIE